MTTLADICNAATDEVLESPRAQRFGIVMNDQISNGACELWANALVRRLQDSKKIWIGNAHCMVEWHGFQFDSDTTFEELEDIEAEVWIEGRKQPIAKPL